MYYNLCWQPKFDCMTAAGKKFQESTQQCKYTFLLVITTSLLGPSGIDTRSTCISTRVYQLDHHYFNLPSDLSIALIMDQMLKQEIAAVSHKSSRSNGKTIRAFLCPINARLNNQAPVIPIWDQHGTIIVTLAYGSTSGQRQWQHLSKSESDFMSAPNTWPEDDVIASALTAIRSCCEALSTPIIAGGLGNPVEHGLNQLRGRHYVSEQSGALTCTIRHDMVHHPDDRLIVPLKSMTVK